MDSQERTENLAQLIKRLKDTYKVNESEIARRIGVAPSTVNSWTLQQRGKKRGPNPESLRALAREFPKFSENEIFAAAGRKAPGPLATDAEERILRLYRKLTAEEQAITETQMRALAERNHPADS